MVISVANALSAYSKATAGGASKGLSAAADSSVGSFSDTLKDFIGDAVDSVKKSEDLAAKGAVGKADMQEVIMAVSNAEMMMTTITSIRDKVITAYQEVIRTAV
ncbi:MAG: flagellar hook-basal body complex protein FliE [Alphaproteobacteria bacterium]|nr:flagellar hook-basal body complex protein FliE [Alphaproteobacteria bacterium]